MPRARVVSAAVALFASLTVLASCSSVSTGSGTASSTAAGGSVPTRASTPFATGVDGPLPDAARLDPLQLVGVWQVVAPGVKSRTVLQIGSDLQLAQPCGRLLGAWNADEHGSFAGYFDSSTGSCFPPFPPGGPTPDWLNVAVGYRIDGPNRLLTDNTGKIVARLLPAAGKRPVVTAEQRARLSHPASPLPQGVRAATSTELVGRWIVAGGQRFRTGEQPYLQFDGRGSWEGSDGCNGHGGRWAIGPAGALVTVNGIATLALCPGAPVEQWMIRASRAAMDGSTLVLVGAGGGVLARMQRS